MQKTYALAALASIGAGTAIAITASGGASGQSPAPVTFSKQTFTLQEKDTNDFGFLDNAPKTKIGKNGPRRVSPADQLVFHSKIVDAGKTIGGLYAHCTVVTGGTFSKASSDCTATYELPTGKLFVGVGGTKVFSDNADVNGAVTGGTGAYAGATGTFTSTNSSNAKDTFTIYVPAGG